MRKKKSRCFTRSFYSEFLYLCSSFLIPYVPREIPIVEMILIRVALTFQILFGLLFSFKYMVHMIVSFVVHIAIFRSILSNQKYFHFHHLILRGVSSARTPIAKLYKYLIALFSSEQHAGLNCVDAIRDLIVLLYDVSLIPPWYDKAREMSYTLSYKLVEFRIVVNQFPYIFFCQKFLHL